MLFQNITCASLLTLTLAATHALAAPPTTDHQIPYQGRLDLDGVAMNGQFDLWLELYPTPTGGDCQVTPPPSTDCIWADELTGVDVVGGAFSVVLGSTSNPLGDAIWQNPEVYLGIRVAPTGDAYTPLVGRQRILAVPMAARADTAEDTHVSDSLTVDGASVLRGNITAEAGATVQGTLAVSGQVTASSNVTVNGTLTAARVTSVSIENCGGNYTCTPYECLARCIALGRRMATYEEVYALASAGQNMCSFVWMVHGTHPENPCSGYSMYTSQPNTNCGRAATGNRPRMEGVSHTNPWSSTWNINCACARVR